MDGYHIGQQINLASTLLLSNSSFGYLHSSAEIWVKKIKNGLFSSMTDHTKAHVPVVSWAFPRFYNSKWLVNLEDASPACICLPLYRFASFLFCVFSLPERGIVIVKYVQEHNTIVLIREKCMSSFQVPKEHKSCISKWCIFYNIVSAA